MNFENSITLNFPSIMLETLETLKRFKSFMKLNNPTCIHAKLSCLNLHTNALLAFKCVKFSK